MIGKQIAVWNVVQQPSGARLCGNLLVAAFSIDVY